MLKAIQAGAIALLLPAVVWSQATFRPKFFERAIIEHHDGKTSVTANYPLPLYQALAAIQGEYGWRVNWESAPGYSRYDLADDTAPKWRLTHPAAKGVTRPSGGLFTTMFPNPKDTSSPAQEMVLQKVISDYNNTGNPGNYTLRIRAHEPPAVIGTAVRDNTGQLRTITPVLDTPVDLPRATRSVQDTVSLIMNSLRSSGVNIIPWTAGSVFDQTLVTLGGKAAPARDLLMEALDASGRPLQYGLFYNADRQEYQLSITIPMKDMSGENGQRRLVPIDRVPKH